MKKTHWCHQQRLEPRCTGSRKGVGLGRPGREAYMQVYMYKNKFWDKFSKKPNNKFIHVDLHVGFPARAAQADSFSAARTPRVSCLSSSSLEADQNYRYIIP